MHTCTLTRTTSLSYRGISLSYALFHFPCVILIEQQFSPYILKGYLCTVLLLLLYVIGFGKIGLNAANNFFQYPRVKPYVSIFFEKHFMAEMDRHQLALAYDAL